MLFRALVAAFVATAMLRLDALPVRVTILDDGTPLGVNLFNNDHSGVFMSDDGRWVIFSATTAADGYHPDVYVYDVDAHTTVKLSVFPGNPAPSARGCTLSDATADGRFVLMSCIDSGWFVDYADPFYQSGNYFEYVLLDRDTDVDGTFDEIGSTSMISAGDLINGFRVPFVGTPALSSISGDGRYVVIYARNIGYNGQIGICASYLWRRDRDTDGDGVFDEPGSVSFDCLAPSLAIGITTMFQTFDGSQMIFEGWAYGHPDLPNPPAATLYAYRFATNSFELLAHDNNGNVFADHLVLKDISADGSRVLVDSDSATLRPAMLSAGFEHTYLLDRTTGIWQAPGIHDDRIVVGNQADYGLALDAGGNAVLFTGLGAQGFFTGASFQAYVWNVGETIVRRVAGYDDGYQLSGGPMLLGRLGADATPPIVWLYGDGLLPNGATSPGDLFQFAADGDNFMGPNLYIHPALDQRPAVGQPLTLNAWAWMVGANEPSSLDIVIGPLTDFTIGVLPTGCVHEGSSVACRGQKYGTDPLIEIARIPLRPNVAGSLFVTMTATPAEPDADPTNDQIVGRIDVLPVADFAVAIVGRKVNETAPTDISYVITAFNLSTTDSASITATVTMPFGLPVLGATINGGGCTVTGSTATCSTGGVPAGGSVQSTVTLHAAVAGNYVASANITSGTHVDSSNANNSRLVTLMVGNAAPPPPPPPAAGGGGGASDMLGVLLMLGAAAWRRRRKPLI